MKLRNCVVLLCTSLLLTACVTTVDSRLTRKADPHKAVENYTQLGIGYIQQNRPDRARARIDRALEIDSDYAPAHMAMALLLQSENEPELAEQSFATAYDLDDEDSAVNYYYGLFLMQSQRYKEACPLLKVASSDITFQNRVKAYDTLGLCHYRAGERKNAISAYERSLKIQRFSAPTIVNLSTILYEDGQTEKALQYYRRFMNLVERNQSEHSAHSLWLGIKLARTNNDKTLERVFAKELESKHAGSTEYKLYKKSR